MKKIKIALLLVMLLGIIFLIHSNVYAANASISAPSEATVGKPITISVSGSGVQWNLTLSVDGTTIASSQELENYQSNKTISFSGSYTPTSEGTLNVTLTGTVTEFSDGSTTRSFSPKTITVKAPASSGGSSGGSTGGSTGGSGGSGSSGSGSSTTTTTTPSVTYSSRNETVYTTQDCNYRSSAGISNNAIGRLTKDTELKRTGVSNSKVNGYTWSRVVYNGQTVYVASDFLTTTKPTVDEEKPEEEKPEENENKEANVKLKSLSIEGLTLDPEFNSDITEYKALLGDFEGTEVNVLAEAEDEKATIKITGDKNINLEDDNKITVTVTGEDGTEKIYTIIVTNRVGEPLRLAKLVINGVELKSFDPEKLIYAINFEDATSLDIEAIPNLEGARVEIVGNNNLVEGENIIQIILKSADGEETITYQLTANRIVTGQTYLSLKSLLIYGLIALVVLILIIILIVRYVKNKNDEYIEFDEEDEEELEEIEDEEEEIEDDEVIEDEKPKKGRPKKVAEEEIAEEIVEEKPKRGRPKKNPEVVEEPVVEEKPARRTTSGRGKHSK